ncbi:hypothetical protein G7Y41_06870 [Schaalia sp. ZJ405]|uniref:hypothetical protein n=1 Tax=Schaalia sp. ZJ405 TaxID=2709403 RepID=UPI0013ECB87E|nr:hypothetical protein [Schaalia sp. ZJ405]QPK80778.1 hypothetical protein G7Y41_06870 [Schaalia sp. ZJ405]
MKTLRRFASTLMLTIKEHKLLSALTGIATVLALVAGGVAVAQLGAQPDHITAQSADTPATSPKSTPKPKAKLKLDVQSKDKTWTDSSSPAITRIQGAEESNKSTDFHHAVRPNDPQDVSTVEVPVGRYNVSVISPINADGSIEVASDPAKAEAVSTPINVSARNELSTVEIPIANVKPADVPSDVIHKIAEETGKAIATGDATLAGDAGKNALDTVEKNGKANPNMSEDDKSKVEETTSAVTPAPEDKPHVGATPSTPQPAPNASPATPKPATPAAPAAKPKKWVAEKGHWDKQPVYEEVDVPYTENVLVEEARTEYAYVGEKYYFPETGYVIIFDARGLEFKDPEYKRRSIEAIDKVAKHSVAMMEEGYIGNYNSRRMYDNVEIPAKYETVTKYRKESRQTGTKDVWIVDVPAHWE